MVSASSQYVDKSADPWSSHSRLVRWLGQFPAGSRVLDVGAATGTVGRLCQGLGLVVDGLEPHEPWARAAEPYYRQMWCSGLDEAPDSLLRDHEIVICADVLEHMARPEQALRRLVTLQPVGCRFFISVPNIAHLWVRLSLLLGRFNYAERGILDRTHLRFFTRRTITELVTGAGLAVRQLDVTPVPLGLVRPEFDTTSGGRAVRDAVASLGRLAPTLLGYQFLIDAVRAE